MLCISCPIRNRCQSPCAALTIELKKIELPLKERLFHGRFLENLLEKLSISKEFENQWLAEHPEDEKRKEREERQIIRAVNFLCESHKNVIVSTFWDHKTRQQVANDLGMSKVAIQKKLQRALLTLKTRLLILSDFQNRLPQGEARLTNLHIIRPECKPRL